MKASDLHVILVHFNPRRLKVRKRLFLDTAARFERQGATVWRVEAAFGRRKHEVTKRFHPQHIQLRTSEEVWNKEALINIGARAIFDRAPGARYLAWIDADVEFVRPDWIEATLHQLEHHPVVQVFANAVDLSPRHDFMGRAHGFARLWNEGQRPGDFESNKAKYPSHMHPGYGWAWRRRAWEMVGGMLTCGVLGSGDHHMACGLVGFARESVWPGLHPDYARAVIDWGDRAKVAVNGDIGFVDGLLLHHFHGYKEHRGYKSRVDILRQHQFSPIEDLAFNHQGLPRITRDDSGLRIDVARYMGSRKEYDLTEALEQPARRHRR